MDQPIATLSLLGRLPPGQEEFPVSLAVGTPYLRSNGSWACPVELTGLHHRLADIVGHDSLQALCLALRFLDKLLAAFVRRGGHLRHAGDDPDDSFSAEAYFGTGGSSPSEGAA